jgi:hypothetical protein
MVWREGLLIKLYHKGIRGNMLNFINDFIHNRSITVKVNGHYSEKTEIGNGIPQGSVLSPTLFNIFINDAVDAINKRDNQPKHPAKKVDKARFADDCAFWRTGKTLAVSKQIQKDLNNLNQWAGALNYLSLKQSACCSLINREIKRN